MPSRMVFPLFASPGSGLGTVVQLPAAEPYSISEAALVVAGETLSPTAQASWPPVHRSDCLQVVVLRGRVKH